MELETQEKLCTGCKEYWPANREFFYSSGAHGGLHCYCKACYLEKRRQRERREPQDDSQGDKK